MNERAATFFGLLLALVFFGGGIAAILLAFTMGFPQSLAYIAAGAVAVILGVVFWMYT